MQALRQKGLTSAVYGVIIVATVMVFVIQFRPGAQGKSGSIKQECAAEVRGRCIDPKDYIAELMLVAPGRMIEASQVKSMGLRRVVLDGIVERTLLVSEAERLGLSVSDEELDNELAAGRAHVSLPADKARSLAYSLRLSDDLVRLLPVLSPDTKQFDYKVYDRVVRQFSGRSPTEFKAMQRIEMLAERVRDLVRSRARVSDGEAFDAYQREKSTATVRYVKFERGWFARKGVDVSPAAVDAWVKAHEEEVSRVFETRKSQYTPECRVARHILVKVAETATDDEKAEARKKIEEAQARIKKGESFADVARDVSDDGSASQGGDLGCFQKGRMVKSFEDAAFALKPGEVSDIVQTQFGFHLIKLESVLKDADAEAQGKRETAMALMMAKEGETLAAETAKKVLAAAKAGKKLDDALAEALAEFEGKAAGGKGKDKAKGDRPAKKDEMLDAMRPKVEVSGAFTTTGDPIPGASAGQGVASVAFKLANDGDIPDDLLKLDDGYAVMQLKEKSGATKEQFDKERDLFVSAMLAAKQADALNGYVSRLHDAAKGEIKLNEAYAKAPEAEKGKEGDDE